ncbi:hypothetical protein [Sphingopyxis flava]|uniref:Uncharacterized protein n=1 Tax=Sphingopyxis flava TaxID=1507287 RepID=A0A1T5GFS0_9SPHN|nr:hypothetical protein [Sphingopyxis flava]SKC07220.1 hypothetical protein SAMN06295937_10743 [Sphingopyxis flava]
MTGEVTLPAGFEALAPFVDTWNLGSFAERYQQRRKVGVAGMRSFYDAVVPILPEMQALVRSEEFRGSAVATVFENLILSLAHVALAIERLGDEEVSHALASRAMAIKQVNSSKVRRT